jgi:hypothetical protein
MVEGGGDSVQAARHLRQMTKGAIAVVVAKAYPKSEGVGGHKKKSSAAEHFPMVSSGKKGSPTEGFPMVNKARLSEARVARADKVLQDLASS